MKEVKEVKEVKKYIDILQLGKEALEAIKRPFAVKKAKKQVELRILDEQEKLDGIGIRELEVLEVFPLNLDSLISLDDERLIANKNLKQLESILKERF